MREWHAGRMLVARLGVALMLLAGPAMAAPPVSLTIAPASAQYGNQVEQIVLQVTLKLDASGSGPVTVCTTLGGSLRFNEVTRDGVRLKPQRRGALDSIEPLSLVQGRSLVTLQPGEAVNVPLHLIRNSDYSVLLRELHPSKRIFDPTLNYRLTVPGTYSFSVTYRYAGPDGGHADVYRHAIRSNRVTLTLVR